MRWGFTTSSQDPIATNTLLLTGTTLWNVSVTRFLNQCIKRTLYNFKNTHATYRGTKSDDVDDNDVIIITTTIHTQKKTTTTTTTDVDDNHDDGDDDDDDDDSR